MAFLEIRFQSIYMPRGVCTLMKDSDISICDFGFQQCP